MKRLINIFRIFKTINKYPDLFNLVDAIFKTLTVVAEDGMPRTQNIIIDFRTELLPEPAILNLWVCHGRGNPITRIQELRKEVDFLKAELEKSQPKTL